MAADPGQRQRPWWCRAAAGAAFRRAHRDHHPPRHGLGPDRRPDPVPPENRMGAARVEGV